MDFARKAQPSGAGSLRTRAEGKRVSFAFFLYIGEKGKSAKPPYRGGPKGHRAVLGDRRRVSCSPGSQDNRHSGVG